MAVQPWARWLDIKVSAAGRPLPACCLDMNKVSNNPSQPGRIQVVFGAKCQWLWLGHCTGAEHDGGAGSWQAVVRVGIDPGNTQAISAVSGVWDEKSAVAGTNPAPPPAPGSSSAGTSLEANLKHITVTLATWDAVWEVNLDPKWARQRLRLERLFEKVTVGTQGLQAGMELAWSQQRDQLVRGLMWCLVVAPRNPASCLSPHAARQPHSQQPEPEPSAPPLAKRSKRTMVVQAAEPTQPNKGTGKGKGNAAKAKPKPQPGNWLDRDCNAALTMQRIGESRWRPLELCWWPDQAALPAKGREYPGLGYKQLQDKPPKASSSN
ncbi:hypothetical protein QJQ45_007417 [Haematococcus lacustris]|nr:hypothetical protein QJQ45_007417 [Haematococcus lacustris]